MQSVSPIPEPRLETKLKNCTQPSVQEFPDDGFTRAQRQSGWIVIHMIIAIYLFLLLAIVCDDFFVPSIQKICDSKLN